MKHHRAVGANRIRFGLVAAALAFVVAGSVPVIAEDVSSEVAVLKELTRPHPDYPVPTDPNMLFYIQRSTNRNTVVYAARLRDDKSLDPSSPVEVFWRRFANEGNRRSLSFLEQHLAYGIDVRASPADHGFLVSLVSYPARKGLLTLNERGQPTVMMKIGGRDARLVYAYVDVDERGAVPRVLRVDIYGVEASTGTILRERIKSGANAALN